MPNEIVRYNSKFHFDWKFNLYFFSCCSEWHYYISLNWNIEMRWFEIEYFDIGVCHNWQKKIRSFWWNSLNFAHLNFIQVSLNQKMNNNMEVISFYCQPDEMCHWHYKKSTHYPCAKWCDVTPLSDASCAAFAMSIYILHLTNYENKQNTWN